MPRYFDTHCHLGGTELGPTARELANRALAAGVGGLTLVAADEESLDACDGLATSLRSEFPEMHIAWSAGIHPHDAKAVDDRLWAKVLNASERASAIGETGLDYHYNQSEKTVQIEIFRRHIELACATAKPLVIHCRDAKDDILASLKSVAALSNHPRPGILHCFTEDLPMAIALVDLGFVISFSGILTFKNAEPLREVARALPLKSLLIETDSPWLAPIPHRGKTNEPAFVPAVFECLANLRTEPRETLAAALWSQSCAIFGIPDTGGAA